MNENLPENPQKWVFREVTRGPDSDPQKWPITRGNPLATGIASLQDPAERARRDV